MSPMYIIDVAYTHLNEDLNRDKIHILVVSHHIQFHSNQSLRNN